MSSDDRMSPVKVTALIANHVEAVNNQLYISGGGIDRALVVPGAPPPYVVHIALGVLVHVPWLATNQNHALTVELIDADGHEVLVPSGVDTSQPFNAELQFNVGRPAALEVGEEQTIALAVGLPGFPFPDLGHYRFVIYVDQAQLAELSFKIAGQPGLPMR
jgi:hypothetical protein